MKKFWVSGHNLSPYPYEGNTPEEALLNFCRFWGPCPSLAHAARQQKMTVAEFVASYTITPFGQASTPDYSFDDSDSY